ncbi:MAG: tetratricopeptide repeat protein [Persephonella sp.]|nr:tetratricopeptide repeat protein [Persephonella sp.]
MEKKKVPLEKDVDIEFEYKVYMFYDFLKKNIKLVITGIVILILIIATYFYYRHSQEQLLNNSSVALYRIQKAFSSKNFDDAEKLINQFKNKYPDSPFIKVALAYEILIKREKNSIKPEDLNRLQVRVNSKQLNAGLTEYRAYIYYKNKEYGKTLGIIRNIDQRYYNYISALTLKGFTLKHSGKEKESANTFNQVFQLSKYEYFKLLAKENM